MLKTNLFSSNSAELSGFLPEGHSYGFNGMEKDNEHTQGSYDFGARILDTRLGRWLSVDPLTNKFSAQSPYHYSLNNPIFYLDPDGRDVIGWAVLMANKNYGVAAKVCGGSDLFMSIMAKFQDVQHGVTVKNNDPNNKNKGRSGDLAQVNLEFKAVAKIDGMESGGNRGLVEVKWDEAKSVSELTLSDFSMSVSLSEENLVDGDNSIQMLTLSHEMGLHVNHYADLLIQFKNKDITAEKLIEELGKVAASDHASIGDTKSESVFDKVCSEVEYSAQKYRNEEFYAVKTGVSHKGKPIDESKYGWLSDKDVVARSSTYKASTGREATTDPTYTASKGVYMGLAARFREVVANHNKHYADKEK